MSAPDLEDILRTLHRKGRLDHVTLTGSGQAGFKAQGGTGYRVEINEDDPVAALLAALSPPLGSTWEEHLGGPDKPKPQPKKSKNDYSDLL